MISLISKKNLQAIENKQKGRFSQQSIYQSKYSGVEVNRRQKQGQLSKEVHNTGAYSELCQTSKMDLSVKMING